MEQPLDLSDPDWFPVDYDDREDRYVLARPGLASIGEAAFLDYRMAFDRETTRMVPGDTVLPQSPAEPAFLFHTAYCCSTLLARALHQAPGAVALKEPQVLTRLANLTLAPNADFARIDRRLLGSLRLLSRPWDGGGRVLIKPSNVVNGLLPRMLEAHPRARAVLLYSTLEEFVRSCCKKLPNVEIWTRWNAQHLLVGSSLPLRIGIPAGHAFNFVESCVLTWYAQVERYAQVLAGDAGDRLRTLDMRALLDDPQGVVARAADWLGLDAARSDLPARVAGVMGKDAKDTTKSYGRDERARERDELDSQYGDLVRAAVEWGRSAIEPALPIPFRPKPLSR